MNVQRVYTDDDFSTDFLCYRCGHCGSMYNDEQKAKDCCVPVKCSVCGRELSTDKTKCREYFYHNENGEPVCCDCHTKQFENSWPVLTEEEYWELEKDKNSDYGPVCDNDKWYTDLSEAIEDLYDSDWWNCYEDLKQVRFQVGQILKPVQLRIDRLLEWETEDLNLEDPDCDTIWTDLKGLYDFMEEWNKKQTFKVWDRRNMWVTLSDKTIHELLIDAGYEEKDE